MDDVRVELAGIAREVLIACSAGAWRDPVLPLGATLWWPEPSHIASFVVFGVKALAGAWSPILAQAGIDVRIAGVFCHQSPKVEMQASTNQPVPSGECELGDLLVVHEHESRGATKRRAILLQAKMSGDTGPAKNVCQEYLFEHWPDFKITQPAVFDRRYRNVRHNTDGGKYALIEEMPWGKSPWDVQAGNRTGPVEPFAETLVRLLDYDGKADRGRPADVADDDWSDLVDDLLTKLEIRTFAEKGLLGVRKKAKRVYRTAMGGHVLSFQSGASGRALYTIGGGFAGGGTGGSDDGDGRDDLSDLEDEFASAGRVILIQTRQR